MLIKEIGALDLIFIGKHAYGYEGNEETVQNKVISPLTCTM